MTRLVAYLIANMLAVLVVGTISTRWVSYTSMTALVLFALILGLLNYFVKAALRLVSLPLTCLTFGAFALVLNVLLFAFAAWLTPGMEIDVWGALFGAIVVSVASGVIYSILDERPAQ